MKPNYPVPFPQGSDLPAYMAQRSNSIPNPIPFLIFAGFTTAGVFVFGPTPQTPMALFGMIACASVGGLLASAIRVAAQWEKALVFRLGRYVATKGPGMFWILPFFDAVRTVDTRIMTLEIPRRQAITKDNVPVSLDGVIFLRVSDPGEAVIKVRDYQHAIQQYAQTALRDIVGSMTLDEILADRELVGQKIEQMVETEVDGWGLEVAGIRIQDIELPEDLKRVMARQASAEREKRATITKAEGDREAAVNLAAAADMMATSPGALQLRTLQTLDGLGTSPSNTVIITVPMEVVDALRAVPQFADLIAKQVEKKAIKPGE